MIYRTKCIGIGTLKVLPTNCFRYNSKEKSTKFPNPKMKLNKINTILAWCFNEKYCRWCFFYFKFP